MGKGWMGLDWGFDDGQAVPCMDRCLGGMAWCMGRGWLFYYLDGGVVDW